MMTKNNQPRPLRALLVEDMESDALLLVDHLESCGFSLDWHRVDTEQDMIAALKLSWDIVFSDFSMPSFSGEQALKVLRNNDPYTPLIYISGTIGEDVAVEAMKSGAQDYVMKGQLARLSLAVERELREAQQLRERRKADETLRKLSKVVKQAADSVFITGPDGHFEYVNPAFEKLTGYRNEELDSCTPAILRSGEHDDACYQQLWHTIKRGEIYMGVLINRRKNGELFHEEKVISPLKDEHGVITHFVSTGRDITERVQAEQERTRYSSILEATPDLVAILRPDGCLLHLNGAGRRLLGLAADENISGRCLEKLFPQPMAQQLITEMIPTAREEGIWSGETVLKVREDKEMPVSQVLIAHRNARGEIEYLSTIARDISERKHFEAELQHKATHDSLTNLPNRFFLADCFTLMREHARRQHKYIALMFLDLDNFKRVNDSLGHDAGDSLLQQVAQRLKNNLRPNDTIARVGGDEFCVVIGDLAHPETSLVVLRKLRAAFEPAVLVGSHEVYVTFSTGIAMYPNDGDRVEELLRNADTAMYQAKEGGCAQYRFYAPDMNARGHELLQLEADLQRALEQHEFRLYYQPQVAIHTGRIVGVEALIRWQHPKRGLVSPADFIPLLENSGLIIPVGEWVLRHACQQHCSWREAGFGDVRISVNMSAVQFRDENLLDKVCQVIKEEGMPAEMLELEITENVVMLEPQKASEILQALNAMGVRTAIDDFGTGYSSLAYLKRFPLDVLKIDQTFVSELGEDSDDSAIVEASISLAQNLDLEIVAEGVETVAQLEFLRSHNCDLVQGYYLSQPLPSEELMALLPKIWQW